VQRGLVQRPAVPERVGRRRCDLLQCARDREAALGGQPRDLTAELRRELVLVAGDQGASVERQVAGRERMDRSPHDVGDHDLPGVGRPLVALPGDALAARRERQQCGVAREVGGGAGRRLRETGDPVVLPWP
jgi:hypothetical protein